MTRQSTVTTQRSVLCVLLLGIVLLGGTLAPLSVRAAGVSVNLDQFANLDATWQNGNLNGNNTRYPEGGVVPFRLAIEGLKPGIHTIHINYDFTAGGHKAYDFLATWNASSKPALCGSGGGGVSSLCPALPAASSFTMPADAYSTDGLSVNAAQVFSGVSRRLTIWGGAIRSVSAPRHSGSTAGNSTADVTVTFTSTGSAVLLAWGGHLAQSRYWDRAAGDAPDGAAQVSGAPWHMRTLGLDGGGARNQDRSIQPSAIVGEVGPPAPPSAPPAPAPTPSGTSPAAGPATAGPRLTAPPTSTGPRTTLSVDGRPVALALVVLAAAAGAGLLGRRLVRAGPPMPVGRRRPGRSGPG